MPTLNAQGLPLHTRSLTVAVSRKSDATWRARGDVVDLRKTGFVPTPYAIQPSGIIHMMSIEIDFDPDTFEMKKISVEQPFIAIEPSEVTGGECCRDPAPRLIEHEGDRLDAGFTKRLAANFGGPLGCSHLLTLFQLMASTIPLAVHEEKERLAEGENESVLGERFFLRSLFIDGFDKDMKTIDIAIQLADTHSRPDSPGARITNRLRSSQEWKTLAAIDRKRFIIQSLETQERRRSADTLGSAAWSAHPELVSELVGAPLIPGLAGRVFELLDELPECAPLRDSLLQLAPGFLQIIAAMMDEYLERREKTDEEETASPGVTGVGGGTNSCYMWREDAPIRAPRS